MNRSGIDNETTVILYGDNNNWFAAWAFWEMKVLRPRRCPHHGWRAQEMACGRPRSRHATRSRAPGKRPYVAKDADLSLRAFLAQVQQVQKNGSAVMIDVRSPQEFTGELKAPPGLAETCQRGGHIPGAHGVCWSKACNDDGTFKAVRGIADDLRCRRRRPARRRSSPIAGSANDPATLGLSSNICWALRTSRTTTDPGRSGATWWARQLRQGPCFRAADSTGA